MKKLSFVVPLCAVVTLGTMPGFSQEAAPPPAASAAGAPGSQAPVNAGVSTKADAKKDSRGSKDSSDLVYPLVRAWYVGGTIPNMHMKNQPFIPLRWLPFTLSQYRANGKITVGRGALLFVFKSSKSPSSGSHYQVLPCNSSSLSSEADEACSKYNKNRAHSYVVQIPYTGINVLSRAKYSTAEITSITGPYAAAGAAVLTALVGSVHNAHAKELAGGITAGSLVLAYYFAVAKPRLEDNYIAVFVCKEVQQSCEKQAAASPSPEKQSGPPNTPGTASQAPPPKQPPDELFAQGDVIMFRIPNKHDYFNISMILSGETGKTFVSETAEKTAK